MEKEIEELLKILEQGVSPFHVVKEAEKQLKEAGFEELSLKKKWNLETGKGYFLTPLYNT